MTMPDSAPLQPFDVLVADDDAGVRDLLVDFLSQRGLRAASAADGRAAVTALARSGGSCRLVFADISMPGADGFAVLMAARAANPHTYVVMITGFGSLETAVDAVRHGAQDYLTKPFSLGQVDVVLRQAQERAAALASQDAASALRLAATLASIDRRLQTIERQMADLASRLAARA
jgi:DNA-binding NtrC family response regulator